MRAAHALAEPLRLRASRAAAHWTRTGDPMRARITVLAGVRAPRASAAVPSSDGRPACAPYKPVLGGAAAAAPGRAWAWRPLCGHEGARPRCLSGPPGGQAAPLPPMDKFFDVTGANFAQIVNDRWVLGCRGARAGRRAPAVLCA